jgi:Helix-turn-helix of DDE superfamily endonuclease
LRQSTKIHTQDQRLQLLFYRAALPLSSKTLNSAAGSSAATALRSGHAGGSEPGRRAPLVLAYLRETFAELAAGFAVGITTAWRYVTETVKLLAARHPSSARRSGTQCGAGYAYVVLDGTLIPVDRVATGRPFYSGKHKGMG